MSAQSRDDQSMTADGVPDAPTVERLETGPEDGSVVIDIGDEGDDLIFPFHHKGEEGRQTVGMKLVAVLFGEGYGLVLNLPEEVAEVAADRIKHHSEAGVLLPHLVDGGLDRTGRLAGNVGVPALEVTAVKAREHLWRVGERPLAGRRRDDDCLVWIQPDETIGFFLVCRGGHCALLSYLHCVSYRKCGE